MIYNLDTKVLREASDPSAKIKGCCIHPEPRAKVCCAVVEMHTLQGGVASSVSALRELLSMEATGNSEHLCNTAVQRGSSRLQKAD